MVKNHFWKIPHKIFFFQSFSLVVFENIRVLQKTLLYVNTGSNEDAMLTKLFLFDYGYYCQKMGQVGKLRYGSRGSGGNS